MRVIMLQKLSVPKPFSWRLVPRCLLLRVRTKTTTTFRRIPSCSFSRSMQHKTSQFSFFGWLLMPSGCHVATLAKNFSIESPKSSKDGTQVLFSNFSANSKLQFSPLLLISLIINIMTMPTGQVVTGSTIKRDWYRLLHSCCSIDPYGVRRIEPKEWHWESSPHVAPPAFIATLG